MYALIIAGAVQTVQGRLPTAARDLTSLAWVCPDGGVWTVAQHEGCGWFLVAETSPPMVSAAEVAVSVVEVDPDTGRPFVGWLVVPKSADVVQAEAESVNQFALWDKARAALTGNRAAVTDLESFAAGTASLTNTQRDKALRDLAAYQARVFKELNALIKLEVRDLANTDGT